MSKKQQITSDAKVRQRFSGEGSLRVRAKALDQVDEDKLTLAFWMLARRVAENKTGHQPTRAEVVRVARRLDDEDAAAIASPVEIDGEGSK